MFYIYTNIVKMVTFDTESQTREQITVYNYPNIHQHDIVVDSWIRNKHVRNCIQRNDTQN